MGPRHRAIEADRDTRASQQAHAIHIQLAGNDEMFFPEAVGAYPGVMRIREQQAAPARRTFRAYRPAVTGLLKVGNADLLRSRRCWRRRRRGRDHVREIDAGDDDALVIGYQVFRRNREDPFLPAAPAGHAVRADFAQILVVTGDVAFDHFALFFGHGLNYRSRLLVNAQSPISDVAVEVLVVGAGAEIASA